MQVACKVSRWTPPVSAAQPCGWPTAFHAPIRRWNGVLAPFRRSPSPAPEAATDINAADSPALSQRSAVSVSSPGVEASPFAPADGVVGEEPPSPSPAPDTPAKTPMAASTCQVQKDPASILLPDRVLLPALPELAVFRCPVCLEGMTFTLTFILRCKIGHVDFWDTHGMLQACQTDCAWVWCLARVAKCL